jgi:hypothetical protein
MSTNHHTPVTNGAAANAATFNAPLSQLDTKITSQETAILLRSIVWAGKTTAPTVNDDTGDGIKVGDRWIDETNNQEYVAVDVTLAAAIWLQTTPPGTNTEINKDNMLINGGFDLAQRQTPGTLTTIADNKYAADRWRATRANADIQYQRVDALGETGLTSKYYGNFKKITNAGKLHICQIVEGFTSVSLRGKLIIFQAKMKASSSKTIRMAILELQNAGAIDTIPATLVTAFGADTVDPTLGANVAVITATQSKSVTTAWQNFSISVTVPSNSKNIVCAIWSDAGFAINDTLSIAEAGLYTGTTVQDWVVPDLGTEILRASRYYVKTYNLDTLPPSNNVNGIVYGYATSTQYVRLFGMLAPNRMRTVPVVNIYSDNSTSGKLTRLDTGADIGTTVTAGNISETGVGYLSDSGSGLTINTVYACHFVLDAEL